MLKFNYLVIYKFNNGQLNEFCQVPIIISSLANFSRSSTDKTIYNIHTFGKTLSFKAPSEESCQEWIDALIDAVQFNKDRLRNKYTFNESERNFITFCEDRVEKDLIERNARLTGIAFHFI